MAANSPEEGYGRYTYVRSPSGYLVEPVSLSVKTALRAMVGRRIAERSRRRMS